MAGSFPSTFLLTYQMFPEKLERVDRRIEAQASNKV